MNKSNGLKMEIQQNIKGVRKMGLGHGCGIVHERCQSFKVCIDCTDTYNTNLENCCGRRASARWKKHIYS